MAARNMHGPDNSNVTHIASIRLSLAWPDPTVRLAPRSSGLVSEASFPAIDKRWGKNVQDRSVGDTLHTPLSMHKSSLCQERRTYGSIVS